MKLIPKFSLEEKMSLEQQFYRFLKEESDDFPKGPWKQLEFHQALTNAIMSYFQNLMEALNRSLILTLQQYPSRFIQDWRRLTLRLDEIKRKAPKMFEGKVPEMTRLLNEAELNSSKSYEELVEREKELELKLNSEVFDWLTGGAIVLAEKALAETRGSRALTEEEIEVAKMVGWLPRTRKPILSDDPFQEVDIDKITRVLGGMGFE